MNKHYLFVPLLALLCITAQAEPLTGPALQSYAQALQQRVQTGQILRADFTQLRHLKGFSQPLKGQGQLLYSRPQQLLHWQIKTPFPSVTVLSSQHILRGRDLDNLQAVKTGGKQQQLTVVTQLMFAVLSGNIQPLSQRFHINAAPLGAEPWQLTLTPKDDQLATAIQSIELRGATQVQQVHINNPSGDRTTLLLQNHNSAALNAAEIQLLQQLHALTAQSAP